MRVSDRKIPDPYGNMIDLPKAGYMVGSHVWEGDKWVEFRHLNPPKKGEVCGGYYWGGDNWLKVPKEWNVVQADVYGPEPVLPLKKKEDVFYVNLMRNDPPSGLGSYYDQRRYEELYQGTWGRASVSEAGLKDLEILSRNFKTTKMEKKLIGYKLKKELIESNSNITEAAQKITRITLDYSNPENVNPNERFSARHSYDKLKEAGVLDLWFEPVYETEKFDEGDWVYVSDKLHSGSNSVPALVLYKEHGLTRGFNFIGEWCDSFCMDGHSIIGKANDAEISHNLLVEMRRRGFKKGVMARSILSGQIYCLSDGKEFYLNRDGKNTIASYGVQIFNNGRWAEVIKLELPSFKGFNAEDKGDYIMWGCYEADKDVLRQMNEMGVTNFTIEYEGRTIEVSASDATQVFAYVRQQYDNGN